MPRWPPSIFGPPRFTATGTTPSGHDSPQTDAVVRAQALSLLTQPASARLSLRLAPLASPLGPRFSLGLAASGAAAPDRIGGVGVVLSRLRESLLSAGLRFRGAGLRRRSENPRQRIGGALRVSLRLGGGGRLGRLDALPRLLHLLTIVGAVGVALAI